MEIYAILNKISGKLYIGKDEFGNGARWEDHKKDSFRGSTYKIHQAIRSYGVDSFILCILQKGITSKKELSDLEKFYIKAYNSTEEEFGYNMTYGGDGGTPTPEVAKRIGISQSAYQATLTEEQRKTGTSAGRQAITELRTKGVKVGGNKAQEGKGIPRSETCRKLIGDSKRGKPGHTNKSRLDQPHKPESIELMKQKALERWAKTTPKNRKGCMDKAVKAAANTPWPEERRKAQSERVRLKNLQGLLGKQVNLKKSDDLSTL